MVVSTGPNFGSLFILAGFLILVSNFLSNIKDSSVGSFSIGASSSVLGPGVSVIKMSIALDVPDRDNSNSILSVLDRLSRTAKTDCRVGVQKLTSQEALELLRRESSYVAAYERGQHYGVETETQREYNGVTIRERGKFQRETVSKFGGVDYSAGRGLSGKKRDDDYSADATVAVVAIVMLIDVDSTKNALSSSINSIVGAEEALSRIATDARADNCLHRGAGQALTMREVLADYPSLRSI